MNNYKSLSAPVNANRICINSSGGDSDIGSWRVEFPNGEVHIVEDKYFNQRFEKTEKFTKEELSYASKLAKESDCI